MNTKVNTTYKDTLFRLLFNEPKELLTLYNAMRKTDYQDETLLQITTLADVVYIGMKNDVSFIIDFTMNLFEHQSTTNPNMPLRGILYFAQLYQAYVDDLQYNIYGSKLIPLPTPRYLVFCNAETMIEEKITYKLSDAFLKTDKVSSSLECIAEVININKGHNLAIMEKCEKLREYVQFVETVRNQLKKESNPTIAMNQAVEICIKNNILRDTLKIHKAEVSDMLLEEYNAEKHMALERRDAMAEGLEQGLEQARLENQKFAVLVERLIKNQRTDDLLKATTDLEFRKKLYQEYEIGEE